MITINSDLGEGFGLHSFGNDEALLSVIDTANVACGFHAGDPSVMAETIDRAAAAGVTVGAHPGLPDLVGFGRREMKLEPRELRDLVRYQVGALKAFLDAAGLPLDHIKPHGSLYGMVSRDEALMGAVCDVAEFYGVPIYGLTGSAHETVTTNRGIRFVGEFYVDVAYRADGSLIIPRRPAPISVEEAKVRARRAVQDSVVHADTGEHVAVRFSSICIHSDLPGAYDVACAVKEVVGEHSARGQALP